MCTRCFRHFWKTGNLSHNFFVVIFFKNPDFKFYLVKFSNNFFLIWCNVNFECFHCDKQYKKQRKFNSTPYGEIFYLLTYRDKIKNMQVYSFEIFFTIKKKKKKKGWPSG